MDFDNWLETYKKKKHKKYRHFDNPISLIEKRRDLLTNPEEICRHCFYPLIKILLRKNRLRKVLPLSSSNNSLKPKVKRDEPKIREMSRATVSEQHSQFRGTQTDFLNLVS